MRHEKSALEKRILTLNGGSSSIKFTLFEAGGGRFAAPWRGPLNASDGRTLGSGFGTRAGRRGRNGSVWYSRESAASFLLKWLEKRVDFARVEGVGHRVVFGMNRSDRNG